MSGWAPTVSVIIPVHQGMECLVGVLGTLAGQSLSTTEYEIIVADNGGNAGIRQLVEKYPRCRLVTEQQVGSYAARNTAVKHARGEVLAFTDADCLPDKDWLSAGIAVLNHRVDVDLAGGGIELQFQSGRPRTIAERYERATAFPQERYVRELHFAVTANLFVRRPVFDALNGFDTRLLSGGDRDFGERARAAGYRLAYAPEAVVVHPARASMAALIAKARRVAGGEMALWRSGKKRFLLRDWLKMLVPPVFWSWRVLRDRGHGDSMTDRLAVVLVQHLLHLSAIPVRLRALLMPRPSRVETSCSSGGKE